MARKIVMNKNTSHGFTLIELIVVISIISIISTFSALAFNQWQVKANIDGDVKKISSFVQTQRMRAITEKRQFRIVRNVDAQTGLSIISQDMNGNTVDALPIINSYNFNSFQITRRGVFDSRESIVLPKTSNAESDCISLVETRITLGKYDGDKCNAK